MLKLRLQRTDSGRGLGLAVCRQAKGAGVWSKLQPGVWSKPRGVRGKEPVSAIKTPLSTRMHKGRGRVHQRSLILGVFTVRAASTSSGSAQAPADCPHAEARLKSKPIPRGCNFGNRAEI